MPLSLSLSLSLHPSFSLHHSLVCYFFFLSFAIVIIICTDGCIVLTTTERKVFAQGGEIELCDAIPYNPSRAIQAHQQK